MLTIAFITSRKESGFDWFMDSISKQVGKDDKLDIIVVDFYATDTICTPCNNGISILRTPPKPTVWQGKHRVMKDHWWAVSNARNTALCLAKGDYIIWQDDRSLLQPGWLDGFKRAAKSGIAVCGTYEKRIGMEVVNGQIAFQGTVTGRDTRDGTKMHDASTQFWGGSMGCPMDWALAVNGFEELLDGLGAEDYIFGMMLHNAGCKVMRDPSISIIQDRTAEKCGIEFRKTDKGVSPNDKSHAAIHEFGRAKRTKHPWDFKRMRETMASVEDWPSVDGFPKTDWYDGEKITSLDSAS